MSITLLQSEIHVVKETKISHLFRRLLNCPDIITFFCVPTGEWILGYWLNKSGRLIDEIEDLGSAFEKVTPQLVKQIRDCWKDVDWKTKKRLMLSREKTRIDRMNDAVIADQERWDWAKKRLKKPVPFAFYPSITGGQ